MAFYCIFQMQYSPLSLRGYISLKNQEGNSKFKSRKKIELFEITSISVLSKA